MTQLDVIQLSWKKLVQGAYVMHYPAQFGMGLFLHGKQVQKLQVEFDGWTLVIQSTNTSAILDIATTGDINDRPQTVRPWLNVA